MSKKVVILDFDGTLADTVKVLHNIYKDLALEKGWRELSLDEYKKLFTASAWQALIWSRFIPTRLHYLIKESRNRLHSEPEKVKLYEDMGKIINQLHEDGLKIYVLSRNREDTVRLILQENGLKDEITVLGQASVLGKHIKIKKLIKWRGYDKSSMWMIGDEVRDVKASRKAHINCIAVTWGFQGATILEKQNPTNIAHRPTDITDILC